MPISAKGGRNQKRAQFTALRVDYGVHASKTSGDFGYIGGNGRQWWRRNRRESLELGPKKQAVDPDIA